MDVRARAAAVRTRASAAAETAPEPATIARWGLGLMLVAAGAHKLLNPAGWTVYVADWLAPWLVVSPRAFMLVNGYLELGFAALLLADRWAWVAALVAAVSLAATTAYLTVVWVDTGAFGDVVARDVGLTGLALAVLVDALGEN
ncbi:DoxX family membrane protein [Halobacterium litoreum]|uniref:DoxX family membrane protein n=1 Tax=Halobacterium litoreum TaxID=2039234 RepID=A0ABD5NHW4_9EURY|nr:DoxX family membrane protein [Halobacterium litoreum]UHH12392.1 DoxX family membrane protein [Halobacterium litoreum]